MPHPDLSLYCCRNMGVILIVALILAMGIRPVYAEHDVWLIDTHQAPWNCASEEGFEKAIYYQLVGNHWVRSDAVSFYESQAPEIPLVLFAPGYTSTTADTLEVGMSLVRLYPPGKKCRTVFWNWPAEKIRVRLARDIREKIAVTDASGHYMAMFLRCLQPESQICMIGFSFGNRMICDATERLGDERPEGMQIHLVLTSAATDQEWLASDSRHSNVPRLAEKILILYNPADRALKFYPLLYGNGSRPTALGQIGPPMTRIVPEFRSRIEAVNTQCFVGAKHRTVFYLQTPDFRRSMNDYLFFESF